MSAARRDRGLRMQVWHQRSEAEETVSSRIQRNYSQSYFNPLFPREHARKAIKVKAGRLRQEEFNLKTKWYRTATFTSQA